MPMSKSNIDDFDKGVLKRTILNMHVTDNTVPIIKNILPKFKEAIGFQGGRES